MTQSPTDTHTLSLMEAFAAVLKAEEEVRVLKVEQTEAITSFTLRINQADHALDAAWEAVRSVMAESGEFEVVLPGAANDYKIAWSKPRETVKVDPEAVPEEFCKVERKPKLREIGEYLKSLGDTGADLPNWGRFEPGVSRLTWKAVKKTNSKGVSHVE